jgi:hypothetical protein
MNNVFMVSPVSGYLPIPASPEDWAAVMVFGAIVAFIAWRVYQTY